MEATFDESNGLIKKCHEENKKMHEILENERQHHDDYLKDMESKLEEKYEQKISNCKKQKVQEKLDELKIEYEAKIAQAKNKYWCQNCLNEAASVCCFGTLYFSSECQQSDWTRHRNQLPESPATLIICQLISSHSYAYIDISHSHAFKENPLDSTDLPWWAWKAHTYIVTRILSV